MAEAIAGIRDFAMTEVIAGIRDFEMTEEKVFIQDILVPGGFTPAS